jgi:hypothetical protein
MVFKTNFGIKGGKMNSFMCFYKAKSWAASITAFKSYGNYYEFMVENRSSILVIFGKTSQGYIACLPDFNVGCHLFSLNDISWNAERLTKLLGVGDGVTVASVLLFLAKELRYPEF